MFVEHVTHVGIRFFFFQYGIVVEVGTSYTEATLYHWEGAKMAGTGQVHHVRRVAVTHSEPTTSGNPLGISGSTAEVASAASGAGRASRDISGLLDTLKEYVPEVQRPTTPIYLLATEGIRLNK